MNRMSGCNVKRRRSDDVKPFYRTFSGRSLVSYEEEFMCFYRLYISSDGLIFEGL